MSCERVTAGGVTAIVCSRGRKGPSPKCQVCKRLVARVQCDWPTGGGTTCDKFLCKKCSINVGPDIDFCRDHDGAGAELTSSEPAPAPPPASSPPESNVESLRTCQIAHCSDAAPSSIGRVAVCDGCTSAGAQRALERGGNVGRYVLATGARVVLPCTGTPSWSPDDLPAIPPATAEGESTIDHSGVGSNNATSMSPSAVPSTSAILPTPAAVESSRIKPSAAADSFAPAIPPAAAGVSSTALGRDPGRPSRDPRFPPYELPCIVCRQPFTFDWYSHPHIVGPCCLAEWNHKHRPTAGRSDYAQEAQERRERAELVKKYPAFDGGPDGRAQGTSDRGSDPTQARAIESTAVGTYDRKTASAEAPTYDSTPDTQYGRSEATTSEGQSDRSYASTPDGGSSSTTESTADDLDDIDFDQLGAPWSPGEPIWGRMPERFARAAFEAYEERAAICEYDGVMSRGRAEHLAYSEVLDKARAAGLA